MKKLTLFLVAITMIASYFIPESLCAMAFMPLLAKTSNLSINDMKAFANKNFSSFEGSEYLYTGKGDDFVDFGGIDKNFVSSEVRIFTMTITNSVAYTRYAYIIPGLAYAPGRVSVTQDSSTKDITLVYPNGLVRDGNFNDKNGDSGLCGSGSPKTIEMFLSFLTASPVHCHGMRIQASANASQIAQNLSVVSQSPFKDLQSTILTPANITDQNTYQSKLVAFPVDLILSKDLQIEYPITASETVTITFFCDAIYNSSVTLERKVNKAKNTLGTVGKEMFMQETIAAQTAAIPSQNPFLNAGTFSISK